MALITLIFGDLMTLLMKDGMLRITQLVVNPLIQLIGGNHLLVMDVDLER
jgi:hypothetical protein